MSSCTSVFGLVLLVLALVATGVGFGTQFWIEAEDQTKDDYFHAGLWQTCEGSTCTPLYNKTHLPDWFQAVRISLTVSLATMVLTVVIAMSYLCCHCCYFSIKVVQLNAIFLFLACIEAIGAIIIYALKHQEKMSPGDLQMPTVRLGWSFYLVCAAGGGLILTVFFYICETSHTRSREGYQPITPTNVS